MAPRAKNTQKIVGSAIEKALGEFNKIADDFMEVQGKLTPEIIGQYSELKDFTPMKSREQLMSMIPDNASADDIKEFAKNVKDETSYFNSLLSPTSSKYQGGLKRERIDGTENFMPPAVISENPVDKAYKEFRQQEINKYVENNKEPVKITEAEHKRRQDEIEHELERKRMANDAKKNDWGARTQTRDGYYIHDDGQLSLFETPTIYSEKTSKPKESERQVKGQITLEEGLAEQRQYIEGKEAQRQEIRQKYEAQEKAKRDKEKQIDNAQKSYNYVTGINPHVPTIKEHAIAQERLDEAFGAVKDGKLRDIDVTKNNISPEQKAKNDALKERLKNRNKNQEINEPVRDRKKNPLTDEERKARGIGGQSKAQYDAFVEAQEKVNKQNQGLIKRTTGAINEAGSKLLSGAWNTITGETRRQNAAFATEYNEILRKNGSTDFIDLKGGKKLQGKYEGMSAQEIFDAQQQGVKMGGTGKKSTGNANKNNSVNSNGNPEDMENAEKFGSKNSIWDYMGSAIDYSTRNLETAMVVTGGLVGTGLITSELLDEN